MRTRPACSSRGQVLGRPVGALLGLDLSFNPLSTLPSYRAIAAKSLAERVHIMRDAAFKAKVLAEEPVIDPVPVRNRLIKEAPNMFVFDDEPDYGPGRDRSVGEMARNAGVSPMSLVYDLLLEDDGRSVLYLPSANFCDGNLDVAREMLAHVDTVPGLGDGGAHYGVICDATYSTHLLTHWVKGAPDGQRFALEWAVNALTRRSAETVGLLDRGLLATGMKADVNVIDLDALTLHAPRPVFDLPSGGRRLRRARRWVCRDGRQWSGDAP